MSSNDDESSKGKSTQLDDEKKSSKTTELTKENSKICKEIGEMLSRIGDEFEQRFLSRPVAAVLTPRPKTNRKD